MDSADCLPDAQRTATRHNDESIRSIASLPQSGEKAGKHRAPEANTPTAVRRINDEGSLAERLNQLFDDYPRQGSDPLVSSEVAAALQEDGLPVSAESIERMRSGTSESPNALVLEALAYFFNVDVEYLRGCESAGAATLLSSDAHTPRQTTDQAAITRETEPPSSTSFSVDSTSSGQSFSIGLDELGRIVTLLSEAISMNLKDDPANIGQAAKLALTLAEVGAIIAQQDHIVIGRPLLNRIVDHLGAARDAPRIRDSFLPRLIAILEES
ncbi:hypothetical protein ACQI4F_19985 [Mycolicibacterium vaccae]|uniref:hypothetical protein n=1 Tax=Mycolicibacterium vaccae TaxID=1810 RepID=UPI003CEB2687